MDTIGERIQAFAKARYGTQTAFAEALGMGRSQLSDYVKGRRTPGGDVLSKFHDVAGMDINWLLTGEGDMDRVRPITDMTAIDLDGLGRVHIKTEVMNTLEELVDALLRDRAARAEREATRKP